MFLRVADGDQKMMAYTVVSMKPTNSDQPSAQSTSGNGSSHKP